MATVVTNWLYIVIRPAHQATANQIAQVADPTTDLNTFSVGVRSATDATIPGTIVGYRTLWGMDDAQRQRLLDEFGKQFLKAIEPIPGPPRALTKTELREEYWIFDANPGQWTAETALSALKFAEMNTAGEM